MQEHPFVPSSWNDATVFLCNRLSSPRDLDDSIAPPLVIVCQIDDFFLKTTPRNEEATALLGSFYHIKGGEVLNPAGFRNKPVAEGLEAQDAVALAPATN